MKQLFFLFLVAVTCMANQCGDEPCGNAPQCESVELGTLNLDPASAAAIPFQGTESVTFVNSKGFQAVFKGQGYKINPEIHYPVRPLDNCGACWEFYRLGSSTLTFQGTNLNFSISYSLQKNLPEDGSNNHPDATIAGDVLTLTLGQMRFAVPLTNAPIELNTFNKFKLRDSLVLGPKTYFQVYEAYVPDLLSSNGIIPEGIYYTKQQGLVGYYFTNKELWYKQ
jgi:hypothetical protein